MLILNDPEFAVSLQACACVCMCVCVCVQLCGADSSLNRMIVIQPMYMKCVAMDIRVPVFFAGLGEGWASLTDTDRIPPGGRGRGCG